MMAATNNGRNGITDREKTVEALMRRLSGCDRLIKGSLVVNRRRCGNPRCRCTRGELHESLAITYKERGRSVLVHVPRHLNTAARRAIENYHDLKRIVTQISELNLNEFKERASKDREQRRRMTAQRYGKSE